MDRRTFLKKIGATAVGAYLVTMFPGVFASAAPSTITSVASGSWSDSNIWNPRRVPSSATSSASCTPSRWERTRPSGA